MKTASVRELRNEFGRISKWLAQGQTVEILKRGKPVADLVPRSTGKPTTLLGCTPSPFPLPDDIDDPVEAEWEALK